MAKLRKCPKCRSVDLVWREHCVATTTLDQSSAGIDPEGNHGFGADPYMVTGWRLECDHTWRARGVVQVTGLPGHPSYEQEEVRSGMG